MKKSRKEQPLPVAGLKPDNFPLYSLESRVAARALAERKSKTKVVLQVQYVSTDGRVSDGPLVIVDC